MPDPRPDAVSSFPWHAVGTALAATAVGLVAYVGFTAVHIADMAAPDTETSIVAEPPVYVAASATPEAPATYASNPEDSEDTEDTEDTEAEPSRDDSRPKASPPSKTAEPAGKSGTASPRTKTATDAPEPNRKQKLEIKHATWADRQIASMLRSLPASPMGWFTGSTTWVLPTSGYHLTAEFGESGRYWSSTHTGLDFAAATGTPVRAVTSGTVTFVGSAGAYGTKIEITHPDGSETWYCHLSRADVAVGTQVGTGAMIGAVGATGNVTGPHLHFEVRTDAGSAVDPYDALVQHGVRP